MPKKRGNGQGTVERYAPGNWKAIIKIGYRDGDFSKPIRRTKSGFKTKTEALNYITELKNRKTNTKLTLKEAFEQFLLSHTAASKSTVNGYKAGMKIFDDCLYVPLADQDIDELQACLDNSDKGYSTKHNAKTALGLTYKWAIPRGYVPDNLNLANYLKRLTGTTTSPRRGFTEEELRKIKKSIGVIPYAEYIYCNCYLGFRPSAFLNLTEEDYNPKEKAFVGGIKTEAGIDRTVTVSPKIQQYVDDCIARCKGGYIFGEDGMYMNLKKYREYFYRCIDVLGIQEYDAKDKEITPHSCRHTFATLMKKVDAPNKDKLALIGHTSDEMLRYYQDVNYEDLRSITDRLA